MAQGSIAACPTVFKTSSQYGGVSVRLPQNLTPNSPWHLLCPPHQVSVPRAAPGEAEKCPALGGMCFRLPVSETPVFHSVFGHPQTPPFFDCSKLRCGAGTLGRVKQHFFGGGKSQQTPATLYRAPKEPLSAGPERWVPWTTRLVNRLKGHRKERPPTLVTSSGYL